MAATSRSLGLMRSSTWLGAVLSSASLTVAMAASSASSSATDWCSNTASVVLTSCGDQCVSDLKLKNTPAIDVPCVQYPSKAATTCSEDARNKCTAYDDACTYQCLQVYNTVSAKWTLFVKDPALTDTFTNTSSPTDRFPAAPVQAITGYQFSEEVKMIQITGFDNANVQKGSVKTVKLGDNVFEKAAVAESLVLTNLDLSKLATNFLPLSVSSLVLENCKLSDVPTDVGNMLNLRQLSLAKNSITDLPGADNKITKALQQLTTLSLKQNDLTTFDWSLPELTSLDLSENKLTEFPMALFDLTKLTSVSLSGNSIKNLTVTQAQFSFLKRLDADSTLGLASVSGSCASGQTEDTALGSVVCISDGSGSSDSGGGSSNVLVIVIVVLAVVLVLGGVSFYCYRRRSKATSEFYVSVIGDNNRNGGATGNNSSSGGNRSRGLSLFAFGRQSRAQSTTNNTGGSASGGTGGTGGGVRGSIPSSGGRQSRGASIGTRPSSMFGRPRKTSASSAAASLSVGTYSELSKFPDERRGTAATSTEAGRVGHSRERARINENVVRISNEEIRFTRTIAKGAFGEVYLAHFGVELVAVKKLLVMTEASIGDFLGELNLLANLSHPRIVGLVGATWDDDALNNLQIVTEFMDSGDLLTVLRRSSPTDLTWNNGKAAYCVQICEAVFYLHSLQPALIHRDIKSRNILVDSRKGAKLSDFGESRERTVHSTMTAGVGTARWVAPEIIIGEDYSELADIYSLGVLLTELDTHLIPFEKMQMEEAMIVQQVAVGKLRPKVSDTCPEVIRRLAHECLQFDPQLRPTAARVLQTLMSSQLIRRLSTISDSE
ncbi:hypothetical protein Poli38472_002787 [Pythium oligandrum]|uniref:Protein kinase domain-containing protein n=1 Tax=Pythium oligandrum TaxID=41045 RepID=A0A8K1CHU0_PYTOL|nr:hypothetical protein Poli38472_002787 [Pythium oligandrum]|eukprot:TMW63846.1 hypothetical protein Poli38472_002787 [Pythium oligandrum]